MIPQVNREHEACCVNLVRIDFLVRLSIDDTQPYASVNLWVRYDFSSEAKSNIRRWSYRASVLVTKAAHACPNGLLGDLKDVSSVSLREALEAASGMWLLYRLQVWHHDKWLTGVKTRCWRAAMIDVMCDKRLEVVWRGMKEGFSGE